MCFLILTQVLKIRCCFRLSYEFPLYQFFFAKLILKHVLFLTINFNAEANHQQ